MTTDAVAGRVVDGRYQLLEMLGTGPIGPVWRAHDRVLGREVAIREVELPDLLDDAEQAALAEKVIREAAAASQLHHPGAVSVLDVVVDGTQPYVVSELVSGRTLADVVEAEGPLPPGQVAEIGRQLLAALTAAHELGLVHRDVRPSNVVLTEAGARLADFGVASMVDDPTLTASGVIPDPSYLAPEQTESAGATALSDLWSLGATLYFAVEGVPPFHERDPVTTIAAIVGGPPRPTQRAGPLQPVLDALLVKQVMDRPADDDVLALLGAVPPSSAAAPKAVSPVTAPPVAAAPPDPVAPAPPTVEEEEEENVGGDDDALWSALAPPPPVSVAGPHAAAPNAGGPPNIAPPAPAPADTASAGMAPAPAAGSPAAPALQPPADEPWLAAVPADSLPPPAAAATTAEPEAVEAEPVEAEDERRSRLPRGVWVAVLALLVGGVMVALLVTGGRSLQKQRPTIEKAQTPADVSTWIPFTDPTTRFTVRYPPTWSVRRSGNQTFFVDPDRLSYLEIDHQEPPPPDLVASMYEQETAFSSTHENYKRILIEKSTYQNAPASLWEFTYVDDGTQVRAIDIDTAIGRYGIKLFFQARAEDWEQAKATFETFKSTFVPPA